MRVTIDVRHKRGIPMIRMKWQDSTDDDVHMQHLGVALYDEIVKQLEVVCNRVGGKAVTFVNEGRVG